MALAFVACGGRLSVSDDASVDPAKWTDCSSPSGYAICGGPKKCLADERCGCFDWQVAWHEVETVSFCGYNNNPLGLVTGDCSPCGSGYVCAPPFGRSPMVLQCVPWEIGKLYDGAGAGATVRYADLSMWTGERVGGPAAACPPAGTQRVCGGGCGECLQREICAGLSPTRRVGFCEDLRTASRCSLLPNGYQCGAGLACFTFVVEPAAQVLADEYGYCMEPSRCADLAPRVGGKCKGP